MSKIWQLVGVAAVGLSFSLVAAGCKPATMADKMQGEKQDKMAADMVKGGKMEPDKMATDKMSGNKMETDKMKDDMMKDDKVEKK